MDISVVAVVITIPSLKKYPSCYGHASGALREKHTGWVTPGKLYHLSVPQFPVLKMEVIVVPPLQSDGEDEMGSN